MIIINIIISLWILFLIKPDLSSYLGASSPNSAFVFLYVFVSVFVYVFVSVFVYVFVFVFAT